MAEAPNVELCRPRFQPSAFIHYDIPKLAINLDLKLCPGCQYLLWYWSCGGSRQLLGTRLSPRPLLQRTIWQHMSLGPLLQRTIW